MASITKINGRWRALIRRKGRNPISKYFDTKAKAEVWARDIEGQIDRGQAVQVKSQKTVADLIDDYRKMRDASHPIADTSNEHYILKCLKNYLGDIRASALTKEHLYGFAQRRHDEGAGPYTVNMDISKFGTVLKYVGEGIPDVVGQARPRLTYLKLIGGGGKRERRPEEDELDRILEVLSERHGDIVRFAVMTAMRRGEICRILWEDLNPAKKTIVIRDRKDPRNKVGNHEVIPLLGGSWELVQRQPREDERIFPVHPQTLSKAFNAACVKLGIPDLHFHDLRHEGVSRMFEQGFAIQQVALVSGHKKWDQLRRYTQLTPESLHDHDIHRSIQPRPDSPQTVPDHPHKS